MQRWHHQELLAILNIKRRNLASSATAHFGTVRRNHQEPRFDARRAAAPMAEIDRGYESRTIGGRLVSSIDHRHLVGLLRRPTRRTVCPFSANCSSGRVHQALHPIDQARHIEVDQQTSGTASEPQVRQALCFVVARRIAAAAIAPVRRAPPSGAIRWACGAGPRVEPSAFFPLTVPAAGFTRRCTPSTNRDKWTLISRPADSQWPQVRQALCFVVARRIAAAAIAPVRRAPPSGAGGGDRSRKRVAR